MAYSRRRRQGAPTPSGGAGEPYFLGPDYPAPKGEIIAAYTDLIAEIVPESTNESFLKWLNAEVPQVVADSQ
jgi:hypothetical protein